MDRVSVAGRQRVHELHDKMTEARLQQECFTWHWNTYPDERKRLFMIYNNPKSREHGAVLKAMGLVSGVADMAYVRDGGGILFIEFKTPEGEQSDAQRAFMQAVTEVGAGYVVVRTLEEFKAVLASYQH